MISGRAESERRRFIRYDKQTGRRKSPAEAGTVDKRERRGAFRAQAGRDVVSGSQRGEVALKLGQIVATAVLDVTIAVDARARKHLAVKLVQGAGVASGQVAARSACGIAAVQRGELGGVPVARLATR
jgi:hypothetical protein